MQSFLNLFESKNPSPSVGDSFECLSDSIMEGAPCTGKISKVRGKEITLVRNDQEEIKTIHADDYVIERAYNGFWFIDTANTGINEGLLSERIKGRLSIVSRASLDRDERKSSYKARPYSI